MDRRTFLAGTGAVLLAAPLAAEAQQARKAPLIGILWNNPLAATAHIVEAFRQGLRELGYVEGQNIVIEFRSAEGRMERAPDLAAELVGLKVDVIVTGTTPGVRAAQQATSTIPIVMGISYDAVLEGLVASLARPGGNVTGLSLLIPELMGKRLELLKEVVPKVSLVAVLWNGNDPGLALVFKQTVVATRASGVRLRPLEVRADDEFGTAFQTANREHVGAVIMIDDPFTFRSRTLIAALAAKHRLPMMAGFREFTEAGGLISYGANLADSYRRAAAFVDKILKGAKPGDLPVEQPTKFELAINLKTAKALGLTIPQSLLARADQVIQ